MCMPRVCEHRPTLPTCHVMHSCAAKHACSVVSRLLLRAVLPLTHRRATDGDHESVWRSCGVQCASQLKRAFRFKHHDFVIFYYNGSLYFLGGAVWPALCRRQRREHPVYEGLDKEPEKSAEREACADCSKKLGAVVLL